MTVTNCKFNSNQATNGNGGAIDAAGNNVTLNNDGFTSNTSLKNGGAVYADNGGYSGIALTVNPGTQFTSNQVTGSGDRSNYYGGAIFTTDALTVTGSANAHTSFNSNSATDGGGAIMFEPPDANATITATITGVSFLNNTAETGGAFFSYVSSTQSTVNVTLVGCLFQGNQANGPAGDNAYMRGGAVAIIHSTSGSATATATLTNDTFYHNSSENQGGAIWLYIPQTGTGTSSATLTSLTVYQNQAASQGGGLYISDPGGTGAPKPEVWNSIIAGNVIENPAADGPDVYGVVNSQGHNLIGQAGLASGNDGWVGSDLKGSANTPLDPGLNPNGPTDNGGPTKTIQLVSGSLAYRAGDPTLANAGQPFNQDQRGLTRSQQFVSIGAYDPDAS